MDDLLWQLFFMVIFSGALCWILDQATEKRLDVFEEIEEALNG